MCLRVIEIKQTKIRQLKFNNFNKKNTSLKINRTLWPHIKFRDSATFCNAIALTRCALQ